MRLLLDTHVALWWLAGTSLAPATADAIADATNEVFVSAASVWEVEIKSALGKLKVDADFVATLRAEQIDPLPIAWAHAVEAGRLPAHHRDPFDRMLVAQARVERLTLVTRDERLGAYDVPRLTA